MGPLALMARQAGFNVYGTDIVKGAIYNELVKAGVEVRIGTQDGAFLQEKINDGIDWFVYTSALKSDHPELKIARENGIKCSKRDELTNYLIEKLGLKMVAVAGTHGKTTTTAMIVWAALKLGLPVSYIVGTTLGFAPSGSHKDGDKYFVYEADEYDRNFLHYHPWLAVIPSVSYDHPDIYKTREEYEEAFGQFKAQSRKIIEYSAEGDDLGVMPSDFQLAGEIRRIDASLAAAAIMEMLEDEARVDFDREGIIEILNDFPGVGRRFERISDGVYSDYAHHPEEIDATMGVVIDEKERLGKVGVVVVYQPHQNTRQHEVKDGYKSAFMGADKVFWLPTYLTREDEGLEILEPMDFIELLENREVAEGAELNEELEARLKKYLGDGYLVVLMTAGPADGWMREKFAE